MAYSRCCAIRVCAIAGTRSCDARCPLCMASSKHARARARSWRVLTHTHATNTLARTPRRVDPPNETYHFYLLVPLFEVLLFVGWANVANVLMNPFRRYPDGIDWPAAAMRSSCTAHSIANHAAVSATERARRARRCWCRAHVRRKGEPSAARPARARALTHVLSIFANHAGLRHSQRRGDPGAERDGVRHRHQRKGEQHGRLRTEPRQPERDGALGAATRARQRERSARHRRVVEPPALARVALSSREAEEVQATETCERLLLPSGGAHGARARAHAPATHVVGGRRRRGRGAREPGSSEGVRQAVRARCGPPRVRGMGGRGRTVRREG